MSKMKFTTKTSHAAHGGWASKVLSVAMSGVLAVGMMPAVSVADGVTNDAAISETEIVGVDAASADADSTGVQAAESTANSWRYTNGMLAQDVTTDDASLASGTAWSLVDGNYINNNGEVIPNAVAKGIDVSEWQGDIDWEKVKADGIDYAIIRCGYGSNSTDQDDKKWLYNVSECERLGIPYGVYLYSYAWDTSSAKDEAEHVLRLLSGHHPQYPVYWDLEESSMAGENTTLARIADTFCTAIESAGYTPGVYSGLNWWNNYLTDPVFDKWERWVAQWNSSCWYTGTYHVWQCTSKGTVDGISGNVDLNFEMNYSYGKDVIMDRYSEPEEPYESTLEASTYVVVPQASGAIALGTEDDSDEPGASVQVFAQKGAETPQYVVEYDDLGYAYIRNAESGLYLGLPKSGSGYASSVVQKDFDESDNSLKWIVCERDNGTYEIVAAVNDFYALDLYGAYTTNGSTVDIYMRNDSVAQQWNFLPADEEQTIALSGSAHVSNVGWQSYAAAGQVMGTTGQCQSLEAFTLALTGNQYTGSVEYRAHVSSVGWQEWVDTGEVAGTTGQAKQVEAVSMRLTGELAEHYDIYYRVHASNIGWMGWAKNGANAGTAGLSYAAEALQVVLVEKGGAAPSEEGGITSVDTHPFVDVSASESWRHDAAAYAATAHIQDYGDIEYVTNGSAVGTTGESKRIEAMILSSSVEGVEFRYCTHVENIGWQDWVNDGELSGTRGMSYRLEALQVELTGENADNYDVYYRTHVQDIGWTGWAKNGEKCGSQGYAYRMEAIQIVVVPKDAAAPGICGSAFYCS